MNCDQSRVTHSGISQVQTVLNVRNLEPLGPAVDGLVAWLSAPRS